MSDSPWSSGQLRGSKEPTVIFGFQHEDSSVEVAVWEASRGKRALCIASGGETAFALLAAGVDEVTAIDVNPAQLHLIELKVAALAARRADWMDNDATGSVLLPGLPDKTRHFWSEHKAVLRHGLCFCGIVERRTRLLRPILSWFARKPDGARWRWGWHLLRFAVSLGYAAGFRARLPEGWAGRLAARCAAVARERRQDSLWIAELGCGFGSQGLPVYANESVTWINARKNQLRLIHSDLGSFLSNHPDERWSLIALSNIADTMDGEQRATLLRLASSRLEAGGSLVLRSILHTPDSLEEIPGMAWCPIPTPDRSPICPVVGVGRRSGF